MKENIFARYNATDFCQTMGIADEIRQAVIDGRLHNGFVLFEDVTCAHFGVDLNVAVRISDQLIEHGFAQEGDLSQEIFVVFNTSEAVDLGEERLMLERDLLTKSIRGISQYEINRCQSMLDELSKTNNLRQKGSINEDLLTTLYLRRDFERDETDFEICLRKYGKYLQLFWSSDENVLKYHQDLTRVIDLCGKKDKKAASEALEAHIQGTATAINNTLKSRDQAILQTVFPSAANLIKGIE